MPQSVGATIKAKQAPQAERPRLAPRSSTLAGTVKQSAPVGELLQPPFCRLYPSSHHRDDLNQQKADHQGCHTAYAIGLEQSEHDERRHDSRTASEHVAKAVGTEPDFGREQFGGVDAVWQRDQDID